MLVIPNPPTSGIIPDSRQSSRLRLTPAMATLQMIQMAISKPVVTIF